MIITRGRATLISDLQARILKCYNITIGYSHPNIVIIPNNSDFIVCEDEYVSDDNIQLLHRDDIDIKWIDDQNVKIDLKDEPQNDNLVQEFIDRVDAGLLEGTLWFDPGVTRNVNGLKLAVTKKFDIPTQEPVYDTNIFSQGCGTVYKYSQIAAAAQLDQRFKGLKSIIDDQWPNDKNLFLGHFASQEKQIIKEPEPKPESESESISSLTKEFVKYLIKRIKDKF